MENAKELLRRYKEGKCTPEERDRLESWYATLEETSDWTGSAGEKFYVKHEIKRRVDQEIALQKTRKFRYRLIAAASVLLVCVLSIALYQNVNSPGVINIIERLTYSEQRMPAGQHGKFTLEDGSTVYLNGASTLRFPRHFSASLRKVILVEGEAFFDIKHDETKPFIVEANGLKVRVLGTAFNVRSYESFDDIKVTVSRGKVAVKPLDPANSNKMAVLVVNEQASFNKKSSSLQKSVVNSRNSSEWTEGKFVFNNEALGDIAATLQYARNINVRFERDELKLIHCSAHFESTDSLDDIIFALSRANGLSYTIKGNDVLLGKK